MKQLYFDYNATTPVWPEVLEAMLPYFKEHFGNPGSGHMWGLKAQEAINRARNQVALLIGCRAEEIIFTSCATESDNLALWGVFSGHPGSRLVTTAIEHPAILEAARHLEGRNVEVVRTGVDHRGIVSVGEMLGAINNSTRLVSVMLANNETGAIQPVAEIAGQAGAMGVRVHTDAAQAVGKIPVDVDSLGVDLLTIAGHKMGAPKGVGALYVREGLKLRPVTRGGGQEKGLRSGTENVPYIVGLGAASALAARDLEKEAARMASLGELFLAGLAEMAVDFRLHAEEAPRLPNTMLVGFRGFVAGDILSGLVMEEVGASAGAACHGEETKMSHVLEAMAVPEEYARGTIRFSWHRPTSREDMRELLIRLKRVLESLS